MAAAPENMDFDTSRQPSTSAGKKRFEVKKVVVFWKFSSSLTMTMSINAGFEVYDHGFHDLYLLKLIQDR